MERIELRHREPEAPKRARPRPPSSRSPRTRSRSSSSSRSMGRSCARAARCPKPPPGWRGRPRRCCRWPCSDRQRAWPVWVDVDARAPASHRRGLRRSDRVRPARRARRVLLSRRAHRAGPRPGPGVDVSMRSEPMMDALKDQCAGVWRLGAQGRWRCIWRDEGAQVEQMEGVVELFASMCGDQLEPGAEITAKMGAWMLMAQVDERRRAHRGARSGSAIRITIRTAMNLIESRSQGPPRRRAPR